MTFRKWLKQFEQDDTPFGDLARDLDQEMRDYRWAKKRGKEYHANGSLEAYKPWCNSYSWIKNHLEALGACSAAIDTFKEAWAAYCKAEGINREEA